MKLFKPLPVMLLALAFPAWVHAQAEEDGEENERVQYSLILPEEKAPELIRPEETNPFETLGSGQGSSENDTEENQVRDMLLRMPVTGGASGSKGMRVMLGGMRLEAGMEVPPIIPDQQVRLKVKNITPAAVELVWVEKKPSGLPPKLLVIPMDGAPKVRYRMPGGATDSAERGPLGTMSRAGVSAFSPERMQAASAPPAQTPAPLPPGIRVTRTPPASAPANGEPAAPAALPPGIRVVRNPVEPSQPPAAATPSPAPTVAPKAAPAPAEVAASENAEKASGSANKPAPSPSPSPRPASPATQAPDATVLRMLFGNRPPPTAR